MSLFQTALRYHFEIASPDQMTTLGRAFGRALKTPQTTLIASFIKKDVQPRSYAVLLFAKPNSGKSTFCRGALTGFFEDADDVQEGSTISESGSIKTVLWVSATSAKKSAQLRIYDAKAALQFELSLRRWAREENPWPGSLEEARWKMGQPLYMTPTPPPDVSFPPPRVLSGIDFIEHAQLEKTPHAKASVHIETNDNRHTSVRLVDIDVQRRIFNANRFEEALRAAHLEIAP